MADAKLVKRAGANDLMVTIDGERVSVATGTSVAAAVWNQGIRRFRDSVGDSGRGPLCGMGICYECRLTIDGRPGERSCTLPCRDGMVISTAASNTSKNESSIGGPSDA